MPPKTLSNGTLSLKFMQRRSAASGITQSNGKVELAQAKVADAAEWDVGKEVREAWGMSSDSVGSSSSSAPRVVYEASYLPFLHSGHEEDSEDETQHSMSTYRPGRWNNLPPEQVKQTVQNNDGDEDNGHISDVTSVSSSSKADSKGKSAAKRSRVDREAKPPSKKRKVTASQAHDFIKDTLASIPSAATLATPSPSTTLSTAYPVFLRPSGVDAPSSAPQKASATADSDHTSSLKKKKKKKKAIETAAPSSSA